MKTTFAFHQLYVLIIEECEFIFFYFVGCQMFRIYFKKNMNKVHKKKVNFLLINFGSVSTRWNTLTNFDNYQIFSIDLESWAGKFSLWTFMKFNVSAQILKDQKNASIDYGDCAKTFDLFVLKLLVARTQSGQKFAAVD